MSHPHSFIHSFISTLPCRAQLDAVVAAAANDREKAAKKLGECQRSLATALCG
jgi:hypothetical protein